MQIEAKYLSEENYSNPKLIELTNQEAIDLYVQIVAHQEAVNPMLKRYEEIEEKKVELRKPFDEYVKETKQEVEDMMEFMKNEDQKAAKIKEKLVPILEDEFVSKLGELEEFVGIIKGDDGKYYAKINDRVEEFVRAIRSGVKKTK